MKWFDVDDVFVSTFIRESSQARISVFIHFYLSCFLRILKMVKKLKFRTMNLSSMTMTFCLLMMNRLYK